MSARPGPRAPGSIELREIHRRFGDVPVLLGATIDLSGGQIVALRGPNGSGKSTVLRIAAGVLAPDRGIALVCGSPPRRGASVFVPPGDRMLHWRLTGRAEVSFFASLAGIGPDERPAGVEGALNVMGAHAFSDRRVGACSTGQRRRLMLAAGLVTRAPVLVIDEPYSDLDEAGRGAVAATFRAWADAGGVVLYAAPEEGDGPEPDRAITIVEGRIREQP